MQTCGKPGGLGEGSQIQACEREQSQSDTLKLACLTCLTYTAGPLGPNKKSGRSRPDHTNLFVS